MRFEGICLTFLNKLIFNKVFGHVEMDASIMEGSSMQAGAVASVGGIRHPVQLARSSSDKQRRLGTWVHSVI